MPAGRPPKLNAKVQKILCDAIAFGHSVRGACGLAGISHQAFYVWMQRAQAEPDGPHAQLVDALERARAIFERECLEDIKAAARDREINYGPRAWLLERRLHEEWGRRDAPEAVGAPKRDVVIRIGSDGGRRRAAEPDGSNETTEAIGFVVEQDEDDSDED